MVHPLLLLSIQQDLSNIERLKLIVKSGSLPEDNVLKKICLIPPRRDQADYVSETAVNILFGSRPAVPAIFQVGNRT
jgi:hypothetical protein